MQVEIIDDRGPPVVDRLTKVLRRIHSDLDGRDYALAFISLAYFVNVELEMNSHGSYAVVRLRRELERCLSVMVDMIYVHQVT